MSEIKADRFPMYINLEEGARGIGHRDWQEIDLSSPGTHPLPLSFQI